MLLIQQIRSYLAPSVALAMVATLLISPSAWSDSTTTMRFDQIGVSDGLSQSSVMAIAQDDAGFMWFGTQNGLDRYDGFSFRHYRRDRGNPDALASNFVRDLDLAADGTLWVATDGGGVSRWLPDSDTFVTYRHNPGESRTLASDRVRVVLADNRGSVWVGTRDAGLDRLDATTGAATHFAHVPGSPDTVSSNDIRALALHGNALWVATDAGLNKLDTATGVVTRYDADSADTPALAEDRVRTLFVDHEGIVWVGTFGAGLFRFDPETERFTGYANTNGGLSGDRVETILEDDRQRLWIGTDRGLSLIHREHDHVDTFVNDPTDPGSLGDDSIFSMFQDRGGLLWIGTRSAGLSKWNPRSWSFGHYRPSTAGVNAFGSANVTSFTEDASGALWLGTFGGGVSVLPRDRQSVRHLTKESSGGAGLPDDRVMTLITDRQDHVWAGTMTGGLAEIDQNGEVLRTFQHDSANPGSIAANGIMSLHQDSAAQIWAGTFGGGISRLNPETGEVTNFPHDPDDPTSLSNPRATTIAEDRSGTIWVGTDGGGLNYFDAEGQSWRHLSQVDNDPNSLSANTIYALHVDRRGRLWAGTRNGLDEIVGTPDFASANGGITVRPVVDGPGTAIYGIESDYAGHLWLSTSQGVFNYNPEDGTLRMFNESHGLQGNEFNTGATYTGMGGRLYFGGANGFNAFIPAELDLNATPPPIVLTSVSVANESYSRRVPLERIDGLELGFRDYVVTFGIAALDFTAPQQNRYAYRLEGLDTDWVDAGTERRITYTNLEGGDYVLHVRAMNSDGFWNETGISIPIQVDPAPWKTWWAYTLYVLTTALLLFLFWRHHERKLQRELEYSRRLEAEVQDRTKLLDRRNQDLKDVNQKLVEASTTDVLTGLRNRRYMFENIEREVELVLRHYRDGTETLRPDGNNDLLFLMVDLDNFKPVNDNCGHEAGDALLLQVRDVLVDACRKSDDIIRWGGDEFLIVARETNREYAAHLAERIRSMLSQRVFPVGEGQVARVTSSIGYASFPFIKDRPELLGWEEVLGVADSAMYEAKENKNAWVGIEGVSWDGTGDDLYRELRTDPAALAESGNITAVESLDDIGQASA